MEKQITLPRLGETMDKGNISKWLIKENESFERGQTIAEIESDKTIVELPDEISQSIDDYLSEIQEELNVS